MNQDGMKMQSATTEQAMDSYRFIFRTIQTSPRRKLKTQSSLWIGLQRSGAGAVSINGVATICRGKRGHETALCVVASSILSGGSPVVPMAQMMVQYSVSRTRTGMRGLSGVGIRSPQPGQRLKVLHSVIVPSPRKLTSTIYDFI